MKIELKESEKMEMESENERETKIGKNIKEERKSVFISVSPCRSSVVGQYFASPLVYN